mmetsp:Transcript_172169/g.546564  ORF Transcript_172169/g.546564 Transcript_172169/m.546564 type:complete len:337 (+) Transcript_172169:2334-3344(+)
MGVGVHIFGIRKQVRASGLTPTMMCTAPLSACIVNVRSSRPPQRSFSKFLQSCRTKVTKRRVDGPDHILQSTGRDIGSTRKNKKAFGTIRGVATTYDLNWFLCSWQTFLIMCPSMTQTCKQALRPHHRSSRSRSNTSISSFKTHHVHQLVGSLRTAQDLPSAQRERPQRGTCAGSVTRSLTRSSGVGARPRPRPLLRVVRRRTRKSCSSASSSISRTSWWVGQPLALRSCSSSNDTTTTSKRGPEHPPLPARQRLRRSGTSAAPLRKAAKSSSTALPWWWIGRGSLRSTAALRRRRGRGTRMLGCLARPTSAQTRARGRPTSGAGGRARSTPCSAP